MSAKFLFAAFLSVSSIVFYWQWSKNTPASPSAPSGSTALANSTDPNPIEYATQFHSRNRAERRSHRKESSPAAVANSTGNDQQLAKLLRLSKRKSTIVQPEELAIMRFEKMLLDTLRNQPVTAELRKQWFDDGWSLTQWDSNGQSFIAVSERNGNLQGRGLYVIRIGSGSRIVLQAPHRFHDSGTGTITEQLFTEHDCRAAAWNTVHRRQFDLAHRRNHFINAFTRAMLTFDSETVFVQVHGFANEKQNGTARTAEIIISDATEYPGRLARTVAERLKRNFGTGLVRLYPVEVRQLGGTRNEQGRVVREAGGVGFLHLELNKNLRENLIESVSHRVLLYESLADPSLILTDSKGP